jgi:protein-tyrosine phosphatase
LGEQNKSGIRRTKMPGSGQRVANILVVCTGNMCRSPMAEGMIHQLLSRQGITDIVVQSAGMAGAPGSPAAPASVKVLAERGIDISSHVVRGLNAPMIESADLVITMTAVQRDTLTRLVPQAARRIFPLKDMVRLLESGARPYPSGEPVERLREGVRLAALIRSQRADGGGDKDVADPIELGLDALEDTADELAELTDGLVEALFGDPPHVDWRREPQSIDALS